MLDFFVAEGTMPFSIALMVMLIIAVLEGVTTLLGMGISAAVDSLLPDFDIDLPDGEIDAPSALSKFLGWLHVGRVPALVLLILFLTAFGLSGIIIQEISRDLIGSSLPVAIASVIAFIVSLPGVRISGAVLGKVMPKDETEVVSEDSFIGRVGKITLGTAKQGSPAEAKMIDQYGQSHYFMVEPDIADDVFDQGEEILIVKRNASGYSAIRNTHSALTDTDNIR